MRCSKGTHTKKESFGVTVMRDKSQAKLTLSRTKSDQAPRRYICSAVQRSSGPPAQHRVVVIERRKKRIEFQKESQLPFSTPRSYISKGRPNIRYIFERDRLTFVSSGLLGCRCVAVCALASHTDIKCTYRPRTGQRAEATSVEHWRHAPYCARVQGLLENRSANRK